MARLLKEEGRLYATDELAGALSATNISKPKNTSQKLQKNSHSLRSFQDKNQKRRNNLQQNSPRQMTNTICHYCHKPGHLIANCRRRLSRFKNKNNDDDIDDSTNVNAFVSASSYHTIALNSDIKDVWILDSGASKHVSFHRNWFSSFSPCNGDKIILGDGTMCDVKGHGTIMIKSFVHGKWIDSILRDVLFVPTLNKNLLSVGACMKKNYNILFKGNSVEILSNGELKATGIRQQNNLFYMIFKIVSDEANINTISSLKVWHERLGHIGVNAIRETVKKNLVDGVRLINDDDFLCESCQIGKSHRLPFLKNTPPRDIKVGEFIHTDVVGPMQEPSLGRSCFYVNFKDHTSGFRCVYFMKHKSDVFEKFQEYEAMIRNKFGRSIKTLRIDNGKEYIIYDDECFGFSWYTYGNNCSLYQPYCHGKCTYYATS